MLCFGQGQGRKISNRGYYQEAKINETLFRMNTGYFSEMNDESGSLSMAEFYQS